MTLRHANDAWRLRRNGCHGEAVGLDWTRVRADELVTFELWVTLADGERRTVGPFATPMAASAQAYTLLAVQAVRVVTLRHGGGRVEVVGVIARGRQSARVWRERGAEKGDAIGRRAW